MALGRVGTRCGAIIKNNEGLEPGKTPVGLPRARSRLHALPVEYIVETTAKCNLYCPMCPRETHKQPKADMTDEHLRAAGARSGQRPPST